MLDTSALIGMHEAHPEVATYLRGVLERRDDGTEPKTHQVVVGDSGQIDRREAEVLTLRFGLDRGEPRTLQEVADHFELEPSRIAQIEKRALERLRAASG